MLPSPRCQSLTQKKKIDFERYDHTFLKMPLKFVSKCLSDVEASQLLKCAVQKQIQLPFLTKEINSLVHEKPFYKSGKSN